MKSILRVAAALALLSFGARAFAQGSADAPPSLRNLLLTKYKLTKTAYGANGTQILEAGPVFAVKKGGLLGVVPQSLGRCPAQFKNGDLQPPGRFCTASAGNTARFLDIGERVFLTKFDVNSKKSTITIDLMECDSCNGVAQVSSYKSAVVFQFPSGFLDNAEPGQVSEVIDQVLGPDTGAAAQPTAVASAPEQSAAPAPPGQIQLGDSSGKVESILGPPETKAYAGPKTIFVYKSLKVIFVGDKVTDIQ